ncbi:MAG TPA: hypothetical protein VJB68_00275, partial [Methylophilaceae bacterium]|nr:hypothetical protein [Methylophilaceae bacterium]
FLCCCHPDEYNEVTRKIEMPVEVAEVKQLTSEASIAGLNFVLRLRFRYNQSMFIVFVASLVSI